MAEEHVLANNLTAARKLLLQVMVVVVVTVAVVMMGRGRGGWVGGWGGARCGAVAGGPLPVSVCHVAHAHAGGAGRGLACVGG